MFTDLNEYAQGEEIEADICVVGAGAAGISLALEFVDTSKSVLLLESGNYDYDSSTQALNRGNISGLDYLPLETTRLRYLGGTTNHWGGQSIPFDRIDFNKRNWVENSGWPIKYDEYLTYLDRAQEICKLDSIPFDWEHWKQAISFPLQGSSFEPLIFKYPEPVSRFGQDYRQQIKSAKNINCILNANVTEIVANEENSIDHLVVKSLNNINLSVKSKRIILSCGAIQNIKLLLNSNRNNPLRVGNAHDLVGKYFMEHPNYDTGVVQLSDNSKYPMLAKPITNVNGSKIRLDFRLNDSMQRKFKILNHSVFLISRKPDQYEDDFAGKIANYWYKIENKFDQFIGTVPMSLRIRLEHSPLERSRVKLIKEKDALGLNNVELHMEFGEIEGRTIEIIQNQLVKELGARNIGRMKIEFTGNTSNWESNVGWQFHHMGGTRMHEDPKQGVVDKNCKVHGVRNLYIASSSTFPTSGHANPTMNIVALALRLADHIKQETRA